jgi:CheY-like chemotaxis protein
VEALRVWAEAGGGVDMVFTDMVMPGGISGLELIDRLRLSQPRLKALLVSGYSQELAAHADGAHQRVRYLVKPYQPAHLTKVVREVLDEK